MTSLTESTPILARPHVLRGRGRVRLIGTGEVVLRLEGKGRVRIHRGPHDSVHLTGQGTPRHLSAEEIVVSGARGHLIADGTSLQIEFIGGPISIAVQGHFQVETQGSGIVETTRGKRVIWDEGRRRFRLDGPLLVLPAL